MCVCGGGGRQAGRKMFSVRIFYLQLEPVFLFAYNAKSKIEFRLSWIFFSGKKIGPFFFFFCFGKSFCTPPPPPAP